MPPINVSTLAVLLVVQSLALAEENQESPEAMHMETAIDQRAGQRSPDQPYPPTYFEHQQHTGLIYGHIAVMVAAWVCLLPAGG